MERAISRKYYAHSIENKPPEEWQELSLHLQNVANLAKNFAEPFNSGDWAYLAGLWHDLGKFLPIWQEYLFRQMGYGKSDFGTGRPNHSTAGAVLSFVKFKLSPVSRILAYIIAGHHAGLPDWYQDVAGGALVDRIYRKSLQGSLDTNDLEQINGISEAIEKMAVSLPQSSPLRIKTKEEMCHYGEYFHLWIRMLFSCLVDADFLDTEAFMASERTAKRGCYPSLEELSKRFDSFMEEKMKEAPDSIINQYRRGVFQQCKDKAELSPGVYSLTVPTGGGKTLSSMAFALKHALKYNKRRIIVAIPYTSIIEQTVKVYRYGTDAEEEIVRAVAEGTVLFGENAVLEHHSNIDPDKEDQKSKLATENWDAPVIVTTNVQLFESLFASSTSLCRKLHNIANSVIILDEAQMLPPEYLQSILSILRGLVEHFGVTLVICTATQPVLSGNIGNQQVQFKGLEDVREIIGNEYELDSALKRVKISFCDLTKHMTWEEVAKEIGQYRQVLCVVNTRRDCRELHSLMPQGTVHLSANMCGEERSEVISDVKRRLRDGKQVRVISTQLVEAGVDIDFPVVYRALAGIDSIVQSAGRCNREGKLNVEGKLGTVVVFQPLRSAPTGLLRKGEDTTKSMLNMGFQEMKPALYSEYFRRFYAEINDFDKPKFYERLVQENNDFEFQFRTFAQKFHLIDDTIQRGIIVWYKGKERSSFELIDCLRKRGPEFWIVRKLQRFIVNVPIRLFEQFVREEYIEEISGYWVQKCDGFYKPGKGLLSDSSKWETELFIA